MDAYELFVRYQEEKYIPEPLLINKLFIQGEVRTIELIALMYQMRGEKIQMNQVYAHSPKACMEMAETVLTPIVVRNSQFKDVDSSVQSILAAYSAMEMATPEKKSISEALTPEARTRPSTPETETKTPDKESPDLLSEAPTDMQTPKLVPNLKQIVGPSKTVRNFVIQCDEFFMNKSKTRIKSMTTALKCRKKMSWVRAVASKLETKETYLRGQYEALRKSDRHIHRTGHEVSDFVRALADPTVKTFSWSLKDDEAVLIHNCREALQKRCSKNNPEQYLSLAMLVCSIGLPTFQLYTPCSFFEKWCRFKDVTNDNVVKALLRAGGDVETLLDEYSPADVVVDGEPSTVELFMFKYWYSYPTKVMLSRLVDYANANLERCLGINEIELKK
jgi:hypothetical protein